MEEKIQQTLRDSAAARWTVLVLVASMMFFAYMFVDMLSPLASLLNDTIGWDQGVFGTYAAGEFLLNVFGFLILAGIILDKMGVRFTGLLSASLMVIGAAIKYWGISWPEANTVEWLNCWWPSMPGSAKIAMFGFMIFGCGCEMAGTTVSKILAKWFKGKEMALAMGLEMAIARLGVFAAMWLSPMFSARFAVNGVNSITAPLLFASALLVIGLLNFFVFTVMDTKFDNQLVAIGEATAEKDPEDEFHVSDLKQILTSKMFWIIALLCVLYYSAIFPFQRFATNFLEETLAISNAEAAGLFKWFPILAMVLTPFLGAFIDYKGKGASMMLLGAVIMIVCHSVFAFVLPVSSATRRPSFSKNRQKVL
jgi:MFS family permease